MMNSEIENQEELDDDLFEHFRYDVTKGQAMLRIDKFLMHLMPNVTRNKIQKAAELKVRSQIKKVLFYKGDFVVDTNQPGVKYLLEMLEPQGVDSFFNWNFFDSVLQQKEYFSAYVFEDLAADLLAKDATLKKEFEAKKASDVKFAESGEAQLDWIYLHSEHYEKTHNEYPVYRIVP